MANVTIDFSVIADVNPYVDTDFSFLDGDMQIVSGALKPVSGLDRAVYIASAPATNVIYSEVTVAKTGNGDPHGPALIKANGEGFWLRANWTDFHIRKVDAAGAVTTLTIVDATTATVVDGDVLRIELDITTNELKSYLNGTLQRTTTDTTYTQGGANGNFYAAIIGDNANANGLGSSSFVVGEAGVVPNPVITFDMKDAENDNALILNETGLNVTVYDAAGGTELYQTLIATSHATTGVVVIDDDLVGLVGDTVFVVAVRSNGQTVCGSYTVTNGA